ncbi:MAG: DUF2630 family protein [Actinobacteria bacterium]|nr:DUF2630 family protein [Actinomycetota bacterium]
MDDQNVLDSIQRLSEEEHELREREGRGELTGDEPTRLRELEERLDQCWDLLRQRRARRRVGLDPDDAGARDIGTVENYIQ